MDIDDLERHPLSAEYLDLPDSVMAAMVKDMHENGFDDCRAIVLYEGKVLDGWQRYCAAKEADVRPAFVQLADGIDPELFVRRHNDNRRHETKEQVDTRAKIRLGRVAKSRQEGKSIRTIAEEEGVSSATIQRDLEKLESNCINDTVEPVIQGQNGKKYKAKKKKKERKEQPEKELRESDEIVDAAGCPVPANLRAVFALVPLFDSAIAAIQKAAAALDRLEKSKAWTGDTRYSTYLRTAESALKDLRPHSVGGPRGWQTAEEVEE